MKQVFHSPATPLAALALSIALVAGPGTAAAEHVSAAPAGSTPGEAKNPDPTVDNESSIWVPGKGLSVQSEDREFKLITRVRVQALAIASDAPNTPLGMGLILRRARLQFAGNTFGKHNKFKAEFAFSPRDLRITTIDGNPVPRESPLLTWYMQFDKLRDLTLRVGQYKIPFSRQRVISSGNLEMVDRANANGEFNLDRDIGLDIRSKDFLGLGIFRYYLGIYNGEGRSAVSAGNSDLMYLGRIEFLPLGMFNDYSEGDFQYLDTPKVSIGAAYSLAPGASGKRVNRGGDYADGGTADTQSATADITFKYRGISISSEFFWRDSERNPGSAVDDMGIAIPTEAARNGYGWFAQAGYLLSDIPLGVVGRFGQVKGSGTTSIEDNSEVGLAVSYYFAKHPLKLQADAFQVWDGPFTDGTTRGRVQLQMAF